MALISTWKIDETEFAHLDAAQRASLFTMGNGNLCTRGTPAEQRFGASRGTYHSGLYTPAPGGIPYLLCTPDWTPAWVSVDGALPNISESRRVLDMEKGVLRRSAILDAGGFRLRIEEERFVSFVKPNLLCQRFQVISESGACRCEVSMGLDGEVRNQRDRYYPDATFPICDETGLRLSTIERCECELHAQKIVLRVPASGVRTMAAARITSGTGYDSMTCRGGDGRALLNFEVRPDLDDGPLQFDKVAVITADLPDESDAVATGTRLLREYAGLSYAEARIEHTNSVKKFWEQADVRIEGSEYAQRVIRYSIWSARIAAPHNAGLSSIGARNLCGDSFRGGVYWDTDLLRMPFLSATAPERAANHIRYRANSLSMAKKRAAVDGYSGANFPYASRTVDYEKLYDGRAHRDVFVNVSIAAGILHHFAVTNDESLMFESGLRILLEICLYLTSRIRMREDEFYGFASVAGPEGSIEVMDDEVFTNVAGARVLQSVPKICRRLGKRQHASVESMMDALSVDEETFREWGDISNRMWIPDSDVSQQNEHQSEETTDRDKQETLNPIFEKPLRIPGRLLLRYARIPFPEERDVAPTEPDRQVYASDCRYRSISAHGIFATVAARLGYWEDASFFIEKIARLDSSMVTSGGCDGACLSGLWSAVVSGLGGMQADEDGIVISPQLPPDWDRLSYRFLYRGIPLEVDVEPEQVHVGNLGSTSVGIQIAGQTVELSPNETYTASVRPTWHTVGLKATVVTLESLFPELGSEELSSPRLLAKSAKNGVSTKVRQKLGEMKTAGLAIGLLANQASARIVSQFDLEEIFETVVTMSSGLSKAGQAHCVSEAAYRLGVLPTHCVLISGFPELSAAAREEGMIPIGITTRTSSEFRKTYASFEDVNVAELMELR